jgi:DNA-directed RNA polymerase subunit alpha
VGELLTRSEADLLDIRNFGQKSIDEVKVPRELGLALKDSPPGFDPSQAVFYATRTTNSTPRTSS